MLLVTLGQHTLIIAVVVGAGPRHGSTHCPGQIILIDNSIDNSGLFQSSVREIHDPWIIVAGLATIMVSGLKICVVSRRALPKSCTFVAEAYNY